MSSPPALTSQKSQALLDTLNEQKLVPDEITLGNVLSVINSAVNIAQQATNDTTVQEVQQVLQFLVSTLGPSSLSGELILMVEQLVPMIFKVAAFVETECETLCSKCKTNKVCSRYFCCC